jgi:uracil-DNA glycosylase family 4
MDGSPLGFQNQYRTRLIAPGLSLGFGLSPEHGADALTLAIIDVDVNMAPVGMPLTQTDEKALKALIDWWAEAGIELDEPIIRPKSTTAKSAPQPTISDTRQAPLHAAPKEPARAATAAAATAAGFGDPADTGPGAQTVAAKATNLDELKTAITGFDGCALKRTARNTVFSRGNPAARVMIVGEAPGRDEDEQGEPFAGRSGALLDRMFAAIGLEADAVYITNIVNWRAPGTRNPTQEEIATCLPLVERHIALTGPDVLILAGGVCAQALLRSQTGITRLRGQWADYALRDAQGEPTDKTVPALPIFHPSYLLQRPADKRLAWRDMLALQARLTG